MKNRLKVGGVGRAGVGLLFCFALGFVPYLKEMDDFYDDSIHKIGGRKHTLRISDISWFNVIDDIVLCMIKKRQP